MKLTFLVYGAKGWIGQQVVTILNKRNHRVIVGTARVDDDAAVLAELESVKPDRVVSLIGRTHGPGYSTIDYLEGHPAEGKLKLNMRDNLYSPVSLALMCKEKDLHFSYLGTGCIFEYDEEHKATDKPFTTGDDDDKKFAEDDLPNFIASSYSTVKGFTDRVMHKLPALNVRIRMPISGGSNPRDFITKISGYEKICSIPNSMTVLPELLPMMIELAENKHTGTVNLTNPGVITHNEVLSMYKQYVDPDFTFKNFNAAEMDKILKSGRSNNYLDTTLLKTLFPHVKDIRASIEHEMKKGHYASELARNAELRTNRAVVPANIYTPKVVFLTGGAGFIGSNVLMHLVKKYPEYTFINFDKLDYCSSLKNLEEISDLPNYYFVKGDICSADLVMHVFQQHNVDTVMHFAAQTHVDNSFGNSFTFTQNNIMGTHVLLQCAREFKIKRFIHVSTDEVYGEGHHDGRPSLEGSTMLAPTNPYAATKAAAEHLCQSYKISFGLPIIITRGNNVYGPRQYPEKLIPKFCNLMMRDRPLPIHGNGNNLRNFLYAGDAARAFDTILHKAEVGSVYNVGGSNEKTVREITTEVLKAFGRSDNWSTWTKTVADREFNDFRYHIESSKLKALGWEEQVTFAEGMATTIEWYKTNSRNWENFEAALVAHPRRD